MAITVTHSKVSTIPDGDDSSLIRPSDWNDDHVLDGLGTMAEQDADNVNITGGSITGVTIPAADVSGLGTMATQNANNVSITGGSISGATVSGYIPTTQKAAANGVATLDGSTKIPIAQIPDAVIGALNYQGTWNASTNSPTLTSSTGTKGYYYVVSVAGSTNLDGITDWLVGDWVVFNGSVWQKIDNTDAVTSVNGYTGTVVLTYSDVGAANAGTNTNITSMTGLTGGITTPDYITFDTTPETVPTAPGSLYWDSADGNQTLSLVMAGGTATQQIGEEQYYRVKASSAITDGQVVMFTGSVGASGALQAAPATGLTASTASYVMGIATQDIPLNGWGYITSFGLVRNLNTSAFADGDILYYDPAVAGGLTKTIPSAPNAKVQVCAVTHAATNGSLFVRPSFGGALGQYEGDVQVTTPSNGQLLIRDQTAGKWVNSALTAGTAISVSNSAGGVTVTNTAPDQVVSLTGAGTTAVTGTYPNFTITSNDAYTGTVTSVAATAGTGISVTGSPITTSGTLTITNTAPDQTVAISSGTGISVTGTYPNFTVTNTSPSSGGTVTSVTATSPITSTGGTTPVIAMPAATSSVNGYLTSTDWTTFNGKLTNPMSAVGDTIYGASSGTATRLAGNTTTAKQFLSQTGTGSASQAPAWSALPTVLPVLNRSGSTISVSVGNGVLPVLNRSGSTINVAVQ